MKLPWLVVAELDRLGPYLAHATAATHPELSEEVEAMLKDARELTRPPNNAAEFQAMVRNMTRPIMVGTEFAEQIGSTASAVSRWSIGASRPRKYVWKWVHERIWVLLRTAR